MSAPTVAGAPVSLRPSSLVLGLLLVLSGSAAAAPPLEPDHLRYRLGLGLEASDNRLRRAESHESDLLLVPRLDFSLQQSGERWRATGTGEVRAEHSLDRGADDELRARLSAVLDWSLLPQRLYWTFQDHADVESIDPLAADAPDNRQQTNLFLTGPVLTLGNAGGTRARFEASVARADAEKTPQFDHDRVAAGAWLLRGDPVRTWALGAERTEVGFDEAASIDFRRHDLMLRFDNQLPISGVELVLGRTWLDRESEASRSWPLLRAALRWSPGEDNELRALLAHELSDAGRDLALLQTSELATMHEGRRVRVGSDVYRQRSAELEWRQRMVRGDWSVAVFQRELEYLDRQLLLDRDSRGIRAGARRALTPLMMLRGELASERFEFQAGDRRDRDSSLAIFLDRRMTPRWSLSAGWSHYRRGSSVADESYRENVLSLFLVYAGQR